jgi:hypothetical protein
MQAKMSQPLTTTLSPIPLYTQIKDILRERILGGTYKPRLAAETAQQQNHFRLPEQAHIQCQCRRRYRQNIQPRPIHPAISGRLLKP